MENQKEVQPEIEVKGEIDSQETQLDTDTSNQEVTIDNIEKQEVENPTIDAVYNGNWSDLKSKIEKQVADKILNKIDKAKDEYLSKIRGI
jgi:hypothetical protein